MFLFLYNLDPVNIKLNECEKSINNIEIENTESLDNVITQITEVNGSNVRLLKENIEESSIVGNINCNKLCTEDEYEEPNNTFNSTQNNNTNDNCIVNTNGQDLTQISHEVNLNNSSTQNVCSANASDSDKYKIEVSLFCKNLKSELELLNFILHDESTIKHVAHLEIEASKKKKLENIVAEFENIRISSPNPFLFVAELKTFIRDFD